MKTFVQKGEILDYSNTGAAISSGDPVVIGALLGAAVGDIAATTGTGPVRIAGVVTLPKVTTAVMAQGDSLDFDVSEAKMAIGLTPASGDLIETGICAAAAGNGATTVQVLLNVAGATVTP